MRTIKFRAWDKESDSHPAHMSYDVNPKCDATAIMQYTGLKDRNGKDIFEGDILRMYDTEFHFGQEFKKPMDCVVEWSDGQYIARHQSLRSFYTEKIEVIGNIYENPELLEAQKG